MFSTKLVSLTLLLAGLGEALAARPQCQKQATDTCQVLIVTGYSATLSASPAPGTEDEPGPTFGTTYDKDVTIVNDGCQGVLERKSDDLQGGIGTHEDYYLTDGSELVLYTGYVALDQINGVDYYYYPKRHYEDHTDETKTKYSKTDGKCREETGDDGLSSWRSLWCPFSCNANLPNAQDPIGLWEIA